MDGVRKTLVGRYELGEVIGRGGMGTVYRATDLVLRRTVAVKVLPAALAESDATHVARFEREARAAASLTHPGVVAVYDTGADEATRHRDGVRDRPGSGRDPARAGPARSRPRGEHRRAGSRRGKPRSTTISTATDRGASAPGAWAGDCASPAHLLVVYPQRTSFSSKLTLTTPEPFVLK